MRWCSWCADPADAPILLLRRSCCCAYPADALILLMHWSCWCTDADDALMLLMYWCCWCTDALMLLNQDQDLLADLSIAICSSWVCILWPSMCVAVQQLRIWFAAENRFSWRRRGGGVALSLVCCVCTHSHPPPSPQSPCDKLEQGTL